MNRAALLTLVLVIGACSPAAAPPAPRTPSPTPSPSAPSALATPQGRTCDALSDCAAWERDGVLDANGHDDVVAVTTLDRVILLDRDRGVERWAVPAPGPGAGLVAVGDSAVLLLIGGATDGGAEVQELVGLDATDGTTQWQRPVLGVGFGGDASEGLVVAPEAGVIALVDPATGEDAWRTSVPGGDTSFLQQYAQYVVLRVGPEQVVLSLTDGTETMRVAFAQQGHETLLGVVGAVVVTGLTTTNGRIATVVGRDAATGDEHWRQELPPSSSVNLARDRVLLGLAGGGTVALDATTGIAEWETSSGELLAPGRFADDPMDAERLVVVTRGATEAIGLVDVATGTVAWQRRGDADVADVEVGDAFVGVGSMSGYDVLDADSGDVVLHLARPDQVVARDPLLLRTGDRLVRLAP